MSNPLRRMVVSVLPEQHRVALVVVCVSVALALGGAHVPVNAVLALLLLGMLGARLFGGGRLALRRTPGIWLVSIGLLATLLQLLPLPRNVLQVLSPSAHQIWQAATGGTYAWAPTSLAPVATVAALIPLVAYLAASLLTADLFNTPSHRRWLVRALSYGGLVVLGVGMLHSAVRLGQPYGVFGYASNVFTASFINPNHLGGYLLIAAVLALEAVLGGSGPTRVWGMVTAFGCGAGVLLCESRGAALSLAVGWAVAMVGMHFHHRTTERRPWWVVGLVLSSALTAVALAVRGGASFVQAITSGAAGYDKVHLWRSVPSIVADHPLFGMGRGAFVHAFSQYREAGLPRRTFNFLENEWLQMFVDWGIVWSTLMLVCLAYCLLTLLSRAKRESSAVVAFAALTALGMHNAIDFNLQLTAIGLPLVLLLTVFSGPRRPRRRTSRSMVMHDRFWLPKFAAILASALLVLGATTGHANFAYEPDMERLTEWLDTHEAVDAREDPTIAAILRRHPAAHVPPLRIGALLVDQRKTASMALHWINRGMALAPQSPTAHQLAARALVTLGAVDQAVLELRLACAASYTVCSAAAQRVFDITKDPKRVADIAPSSPLGRTRVVMVLAGLRAHEQMLRVLAPVDALVQPLPLGMAANASLATGNVPQAIALTERLGKIEPMGEGVWLLRAAIARHENGDEAELEVLTRAVNTIGERPRFLIRRGQLEEKFGQRAAAKATARRLVQVARLGPVRARAHAQLGRLLSREQQWARALREFERAVEQAPHILNYRLTTARLRERLGDVSGAKRELQRALDEHVGDAGTVTTALNRLTAAE